MLDHCSRNIDYLRISMTDRCNLRCVYCMPEHGVTQVSHTDILRYEEILRIARLMTTLGVRHFRLTGGEPLARKGCIGLIRDLNALPGAESISMTTNGILLDGHVDEVKAAGLKAVNISIDAQDPRLYSAMTRGGDVACVQRAIADSLSAGLQVKLNAVPVQGLNEQELVKLALYAKDAPVDVRFIELMPLGCGKQLQPMSSDRILEIMADSFGPLAPVAGRRGFGPAVYYRPRGFTGAIGVISPMSHEFCGTCNRVRLTADGYLKLCLNHQTGLDLRALLRGEADDEAVTEAIRQAIWNKPHRHGFNEQINDAEIRRMNEIGG